MVITYEIQNQDELNALNQYLFAKGYTNVTRKVADSRRFKFVHIYNDDKYFLLSNLPTTCHCKVMSLQEILPDQDHKNDIVAAHTSSKLLFRCENNAELHVVQQALFCNNFTWVTDYKKTHNDVDGAVWDDSQKMLVSCGKYPVWVCFGESGCITLHTHPLLTIEAYVVKNLTLNTVYALIEKTVEIRKPKVYVDGQLVKFGYSFVNILDTTISYSAIAQLKSLFDATQIVDVRYSNFVLTRDDIVAICDSPEFKNK